MNFLKNLQKVLNTFLGIYDLSCSNDNLILSIKFKVVEISFNSIKNCINLKRSFLYNTLYISLDSNIKKIKVPRSFNETDLEILNTTILNFKKLAIIKQALSIEGRFLEFKKLWNDEKYLRTETVLIFINTILDILEPEADYFWRTLSSKDTQDQLFCLKNLALNHSIELKNRNDEFVKLEIEKYKSLFDTIETKPLTNAQRKACVIKEENNLVLAGAGSGKTSVMIGRCAYLIESKLAEPEDILVIAFNNEAAKELNQRLKERIPNVKIEAQTFHKAGKKIIEDTLGKEAKLTDFKDSMLLKKFITNEIQSEINSNHALRMQLLSSLHPKQIELKSEYEFHSKDEYENYLKNNDFRTLNKEQVKSFGEIEIANYLFINGVKYTYEAPYEVSTSTSEHAQYRPDFYLPEYKIYIEYYGVDKSGDTAPYIDKTEYTQSIHWKRELHKQNKTIIIELFFSDLQDKQLISKLEKNLDLYCVKRNTDPNEKHLELINEFLKNFKKSDSIQSLFQLLEAHNIGFDEAAHRLERNNPKRNEIVTLKLASIMYEKYQRQLALENAIDFHQMIALGLKYLNQNKYQSKWKHILVDEFQDISDIRLEFIKALKASCPATLFCVGDDWQTIYGFTGSKIEITANFEGKLGHSKITHLDKTFRFNNKISDVATNFVIQNPIQIKKDIQTISKSMVSKVEITFIKSISQYIEEIEIFLNSIVEKDKDQTVMILSRNNEILRIFQTDYALRLKKNFQKITFSFLTVHSAKGLEADFVILLGLDGGKNGFPSERSNESINSKIQLSSDTYPFAEERRVFYVTLTRAKHNVLLISDINNPSIFARELLNGSYEVTSKQFKKSCPNCQNGFLVVRKNRENNQFLGCTNYSNDNQCRYTETYL